jgi:uncharacterized protein
VGLAWLRPRHALTVAGSAGGPYHVSIMNLIRRSPSLHTAPFVIGMLHLPPLPGSARSGGMSMQQIVSHALRDAEAIVEGGADGMMLENFGDVPFYPGRVPAETVAAVTAVAAEVRRRFEGTPLGINVLRNDGCSALAIAAAVGANFVRVNVLCGARVTDQGIVQGIAHDLLRDRRRLGAEGVKIMADVDVKHSAPIAVGVALESEVEDTLRRGLADALIVSGSGTGKPTDAAQVRRVREAVGAAAGVLVGSGVTAASVREFLPHADGFIVGTALKRNGDPGQPVQIGMVKEIVEQVRG